MNLKKSLIFLSAASLAMSAAALPQQLQSQKLTINPHGDVKSECGIAMNPASMSRKTPARLNSADDVIQEAEGTRQNVTITGSGYYVTWGYEIPFENQSHASHIVYGEGNEVYIFNILPNALTDTYVKGIKEGNKLTVALPQTVIWQDIARPDGSADGYNLTLLTYTEYEEGVDAKGNPVKKSTYLADENPAALVFDIAEDGTMTSDQIDENHMLGLAWCTDNAWAGYGVIDLSIEEFNETLVSVPEGVEVKDNYFTYVAGSYARGVNFADAGSEVYFNNICKDLPNIWIKGDVKTNENGETIVTIPQDQYIGLYDSSYYMYIKCAKGVFNENGKVVGYEMLPSDISYDLIWDKEANTMKAVDSEILLVFNVSKDSMERSLDMYRNLSLTHQDSFAGVPTNPYELEFENTSSYMGYNGFLFKVTNLIDDGRMLLGDNLYYVVYVDGEPWEFNPEVYGCDDFLTYVPWNLSLFYIHKYNSTQCEVDFFVDGMETVGVQAVYRYNGEETRSEIVTINVTSGVGTVAEDKEIVSTHFYDLNGRRVANPADGVFIKRVTFTDGTTATTKEVVR